MWESVQTVWECVLSAQSCMFKGGEPDPRKQCMGSAFTMKEMQFMSVGIICYLIASLS